MLRFELLRDEGILVLTPEGPLEAADFERLATAVDPLIAERGKLTGVMIYTKSFPGWENFGALVSHIRFVADHHRNIRRIAAVTDSGVLKILPRLADHFVQAEVRHFDFDKKDEALAWLKADG